MYGIGLMVPVCMHKAVLEGDVSLDRLFSLHEKQGKLPRLLRPQCFWKLRWAVSLVQHAGPELYPDFTCLLDLSCECYDRSLRNCDYLGQVAGQGKVSHNSFSWVSFGRIFRLQAEVWDLLYQAVCKQKQKCKKRAEREIEAEEKIFFSRNLIIQLDSEVQTQKHRFGACNWDFFFFFFSYGYLSQRDFLHQTSSFVPFFFLFIWLLTH